MSFDPYTQFVLLLYTIAWCMWGVHMAISLAPHTENRWQLTLVVIAAGPCVWAITLYRCLLLTRRAVLHRYGVEHCGCGCNHHS